MLRNCLIYNLLTLKLRKKTNKINCSGDRSKLCMYLYLNITLLFLYCCRGKNLIQSMYVCICVCVGVFLGVCFIVSSL